MVGQALTGMGNPFAVSLPTKVLVFLLSVHCVMCTVWCVLFTVYSNLCIVYSLLCVKCVAYSNLLIN